MQAGSAQHEHYWDPLRAGLMLLGVPYHASLLYSDAISWSLKDFQTSPVLTILGIVLTTFRMPTFFLVAGYFSEMAIGKKGSGAWLQSRFLRLGIPFVAAIVVLGPLQLFLLDISEVVKGQASFEQVIGRLPQTLALSSRWIMHLWFLPALLFYSVLLAAVLFLAQQRPGLQIKQTCERLKSRHPVFFLSAICMLAILWELAVYATALMARDRENDILSFYERASDPYARYLPFFLIGALLNRDKALFHRFRQTGPGTACLTVVAISAAVMLRLQQPYGNSVWQVLASAVAAIAAARLLLDFCCRFFVEPNIILKRLADASFTIYLVHHPLIYAFGTAFIAFNLPPIVEFSVIVVATIGLAYLLHRAVRQNDLALFLFNGVRRTQAQTHPSAHNVSQTLR